MTRDRPLWMASGRGSGDDHGSDHYARLGFVRYAMLNLRRWSRWARDNRC